MNVSACILGVCLLLISGTEAGVLIEYEKRIVSFNAELYRGYCSKFENENCQDFDIRSNYIADAVPKYLSDSDVICLQGIYYDKEVDKIIRKSKSIFPYSYSFNHNKNGGYTKKANAPCDSSDKPHVRKVAECEEHSCHSEADNEAFIACMEKTCNINRTTSISDVFKMLTDTCMSCIAAGTNKYALDCLHNDYAFNPTGLLLLSKTKFLTYNSEYFNHSKELIRHGYLYADIEELGQVYCTMMQPYIGNYYIDITKNISSYEEKNIIEAESLVNKTADMENVIIAGSLNASPSLTKGYIKPQFGRSINIFKSARFLDPISDSFEGSHASCTFCFNNIYVKNKFKDEHFDGYIFDHVLVKGFGVENEKLKNGANKNIYRVLMPVTDEEEDLPLSAHYGVSVLVKIDKRVSDADEQLPGDDSDDEQSRSDGSEDDDDEQLLTYVSGEDRQPLTEVSVDEGQPSNDASNYNL